MLSKLIKKIKKFIPNKIKAEILALIQPLYLEEYGKYKNRKKIFVFLAGYYQNLGDMAITYSQERFLKDNFSEYEIITIPSTKTYSLMKTMKYISTKEDIITILGGGNMDDIYTSLEDARQFVIRNFPLNRIVSFPQTMAFSETPFGRGRLKKTSKIYNRHKNLHIFTRERKSLDKMKRTFKNSYVDIVPDIVLYLNKVAPELERKGVLCCLRNDKEKKISSKQEEEIGNIIIKKYKDVTFTDTVNITLEDCKPENTEETLSKFWDLLKSKKVVLTDRLHCMIFCAITNTPCVVIDNTNGKISGVHKEWLKNFHHIKMVEKFEIDRITEYIDTLLKIDTRKIPVRYFNDCFKPLLIACTPEHIKEKV
ncbi:polysaccharide pyruvyl transferase family protein [bacterium]|nr:polysaccharide pyruvyl transferase family protein [bacterium]